jgi:hypothetical protein
MENKGISIGGFVGGKRHWKFIEKFRGIMGIYEVMDD